MMGYRTILKVKLKQGNLFLIFISVFYLSQGIIGGEIGGQTTVKPTSVICTLVNAFSPIVCLNNKDEIICNAVYHSSPYPLIAQCVDKKGNLLWPNQTYGVQISQPESEGDVTIYPSHILAKKDGGAFFAFEYMEFRGRVDHTPIWASFPQLQYVNSNGEIQWGANGKRLSNMEVHLHGGAKILGVRYDDEGNILVFWGWFDIDSLGHQSWGTFVQKVDPITGDLQWGSTGKRLLKDRAWLGLISKSGSTYLFHGDSVMCVDIKGEKLWDYGLLTGINGRYVIGTNDYGEIIILYEHEDGIRGRLFSSDGLNIWQDLLVISGKEGITPLTKLVNWNNNKWLLAIGRDIYCVDKTGSNCLYVNIPDTSLWGIMDITPVDMDNFIIAYRSTSNSVLKLQKINKNGEILWGENGIAVMEKIGTLAHLLPDFIGGAYVIIEAMAVYEPDFRPRGVYIARIDKNGNLGFINVVQDKPPRPVSMQNIQVKNYPNPFSNITTISIEGNFGRSFFIVIYNLLGKEVRRFPIKDWLKGSVQIQWDGKDQFGREIAEGIYFYRLGNGGQWLFTGKLIYIKNRRD